MKICDKEALTKKTNTMNTLSLEHIIDVAGRILEYIVIAEIYTYIILAFFLACGIIMAIVKFILKIKTWGNNYRLRKLY